MGAVDHEAEGIGGGPDAADEDLAVDFWPPRVKQVEGELDGVQAQVGADELGPRLGLGEPLGREAQADASFTIRSPGTAPSAPQSRPRPAGLRQSLSPCSVP